MQNTIREYDTRLDSKKRLTLRSVLFEYYHVSEMENGTIIITSLKEMEFTLAHITEKSCLLDGIRQLF